MITHRSIWSMIGLTIITIGFYLLYWFYVTKQELNGEGAQIPTYFLFFIPLANFYWLYKFSEGFCKVIFKDDSQTIAYFLLAALLMGIAPFVFQVQMNRLNAARPPIH